MSGRPWRRVETFTSSRSRGRSSSSRTRCLHASRKQSSKRSQKSRKTSPEGRRLLVALRKRGSGLSGWHLDDLVVHRCEDTQQLLLLGLRHVELVEGGDEVFHQRIKLAV